MEENNDYEIIGNEILRLLKGKSTQLSKQLLNSILNTLDSKSLVQ